MAMPSRVNRMANSVNTPSTSAPTISRRTNRKMPNAMPPTATAVPRRPKSWSGTSEKPVIRSKLSRMRR
jgi:hypothetical protein